MSNDKFPWEEEGLFGEAAGRAAEAAANAEDPDRFDLAVGYKECSVDPAHVYPANYPGSACPEGDGGTLNLMIL